MFRFTNLIVLKLTRDCNLDCKYCLDTEKFKFKGDIINYETYKKIINRVINHRILNNLNEINLNFIFHGGEIGLLGHEYFEKIVKYADEKFKENKIKFTFGSQSNGTLLNDEFLKVYKKYKISLGLSLDGFKKGNQLRIKEKSENYYKRLIHRALDKDINVGLMPVIHKKNVNHFNNFVKELRIIFKNKNYNRNVDYNYVEDPYKNGRESDMEISGKKLLRKIVLPDIKKEIFKNSGNLEKSKSFINKIISDLLINGYDYHSRGCWGRWCGAGLSMIAIDTDGSAYYCDRYTKQTKEFYIENSLDYDFLGIHQLKKVIDFNKEKSKVIREIGCDKCMAKNVCEYGCLTFYYCKHGKFGIDKNKVCKFHIKLYKYFKKNIIKIIKACCKNNKSIPINFGFYDFKEEMIKKLKKHNIAPYIKENFIYFKREK